MWHRKKSICPTCDVLPLLIRKPTTMLPSVGPEAALHTMSGSLEAHDAGLARCLRTLHD
ncbi:hypothetical protein H8A95_19965 [Bradyrhizobium sp. Pear76]|uniref:hypothetical protein n=1 Tax=Bradyrhizobium oropedii TaxID=1571201 RepID=UPI001E5FA412|nr:hypothetical protein [Bradyrhizobium oropedii]MCC8964530.1 hypothetical protein [Bradyrhizobium oropedii]